MNTSSRVLVVEDDAAIVRALSSFLTDEGFLCISTNGQTEALRLCSIPYLLTSKEVA